MTTEPFLTKKMAIEINTENDLHTRYTPVDTASMYGCVSLVKYLN